MSSQPEARVAWRLVATAADDLHLYRVDAAPLGFVTPGRDFDPLDLLLGQFPNPTTVQVRSEFGEAGAPVGASSLEVACHVMTTPDAMLLVDSTFRRTAPHVFPCVLEEIARHEQRPAGTRPLDVLYTHAHFDHAGGRAAIEGLGAGVTTLAHPYTRALFPLVSRPETMFRSKGQFLRDCGITPPMEELFAGYGAARQQLLDQAPSHLDLGLFRSEEESELRVDREIDPAVEPVALLGERAEVLRFDGHIPGHLCVLVDGAHLITGDMWLPATTSTVTPGRLAAEVGVPADVCGVLRYLESSETVLAAPLDECVSYPSHENVFRNPKRMALRDLEVFATRADLVLRVLGEHRDRPMRVLDLAWGGAGRLAIWKLGGSKYRLLLAHDEATAWVEDLLRVGDVSEVEPERYVWTGARTLWRCIHDARDCARATHGHLEFRSRGRGEAPPAALTARR
jgi:glyoxylase-like metal-dependent hydrolase (beta-lactamase superfamily II)